MQQGSGYSPPDETSPATGLVHTHKHTSYGTQPQDHQGPTNEISIHLQKMNQIDLSRFAPPAFVAPQDADAVKDIQYSSQGHVRQRLDLYLPKAENRREGTLPLIVYIHGKLILTVLVSTHQHVSVLVLWAPSNLGISGWVHTMD